MKKNAWKSPPTFIRENVRKIKKGFANFKEKGFGNCLRAGKVLAPHASITRDDNL